MEILIDLLPFILPLITAAGGWTIGRRMREAKVIKTEAEARKTLAEAERVFAQADSEEINNLGQVIGAWRTLFESTHKQLSQVQSQQLELRAEYNRVLVELRRYKDGVNILISQLQRLGYRPEWTPDK